MPNLGAVGSDAIFCEGADLMGSYDPISPTPEDNESYKEDIKKTMLYFAQDF